MLTIEMHEFDEGFDQWCLGRNKTSQGKEETVVHRKVLWPLERVGYSHDRPPAPHHD